MQSSVPALNRNFAAVHVLSVRRAFCLIFKDLAEVIHVEDGRFVGYDFEAWREMSEFRASLGESGTSTTTSSVPSTSISRCRESFAS
ncbi:MAG: hypothetical protein U0992_03255 [Planctomycetaceae bacterium]